ncbi:MAG: hypothetical protein ACOX6F_08110 [Syntrophomonadaceae bacterium]|jgi:ABC-type antimicrobial peptide transport system permease subunit|nr:hypothetical protein [Syntrophomonadaceae bacterium]HQE23558.1 hypothetical protein [Syntrophomonadaceae bacterium]
MRAEIIESIRQKAFLGLIIILLTATGLVFTAIGTLGINHLHGRLLDFSTKYQDEHIFHLYDPFNSEEILRSFLNESDAVERLMRFHERLENNPYFRYLDLNSQSIYIQDYSGPEKFVKGYEDGRADLNKPVDINGNLYRPVKGMQFSELVFTTFKPSLHSGRYFLSSEYHYQEDQPIPLILGSEYQGIYSLGDQLNIYFLGLQSRAQVIGFFNKDSYVFINGDIGYLDRQMVMPSLEFAFPALGTPIPDYLFAFYHVKTSGYVISKDLNADEVQVLINQFCRECRLTGWQIEGSHVNNLDILNLESHEFFISFLIISVVVFIFTFINIVLSLSLKIKNNLHTYAIHLISGATPSDIKKVIAAEIAFYLIIANILAASFAYLKFAYIGFNPTPLVISIIIGVLSLIYPFHQINQLNISMYLRGKR